MLQHPVNKKTGKLFFGKLKYSGEQKYSFWPFVRCYESYKNGSVISPTGPSDDPSAVLKKLRFEENFMSTEYSYFTRYWARVTGLFYAEKCDQPPSKKAKTGKAIISDLFLALILNFK